MYNPNLARGSPGIPGYPGQLIIEVYSDLSVKVKAMHELYNK